MKRFNYYLEIILAFVFIDLVNYYVFPQDLGWLSFVFSPYWIPILLIASRYGLWPGFLTSAIAAVHYGLIVFNGLPSRSDIEQLVESGDFQTPLVFLLTGIVLGSMRQNYLDTERKSQEALERRSEQMTQLQKSYDAAEKARRILEGRIVGTSTTLKTLYEAAQKFETGAAASIYPDCLILLAQHFYVEKSSFYIRQGSYLVLETSHGWSDAETVEGKVPADKSILRIAMDENRLITVKDILARKDSHVFMEQYGQVLAMIPVRDATQTPIGVVSIEKMDFMMLTRPNLEMIELMVEWASRSYRNRQHLEQLEQQQITDLEYGLFSYKYFEEILEREFERILRHPEPLELSVAQVKIAQFGFLAESQQRLMAQALIAKLHKHFEITDMIFRYKFQGVFAVIAPMRRREQTEQRLKLAVEGTLAMLANDPSLLRAPDIKFRVLEFEAHMKSSKELIPQKF